MRIKGRCPAHGAPPASPFLDCEQFQVACQPSGRRSSLRASAQCSSCSLISCAGRKGAQAARVGTQAQAQLPGGAHCNPWAGRLHTWRQGKARQQAAGPAPCYPTAFSPRSPAVSAGRHSTAARVSLAARCPAPAPQACLQAQHVCPLLLRQRQRVRYVLLPPALRRLLDLLQQCTQPRHVPRQDARLRRREQGAQALLEQRGVRAACGGRCMTSGWSARGQSTDADEVLRRAGGQPAPRLLHVVTQRRRPHGGLPHGPRWRLGLGWGTLGLGLGCLACRLAAACVGVGGPSCCCLCCCLCLRGRLGGWLSLLWLGCRLALPRGPAIRGTRNEEC